MNGIELKKLNEIMTEYEKIDGFRTYLEQYINDGGYIFKFALTSQKARSIELYPPGIVNNILDRALKEMLKDVSEECTKAKHYIESINIKMPPNE